MKDDNVYNMAEERDIGYRANHPVCICINIFYVIALSFTFSLFCHELSTNSKMRTTFSHAFVIVARM